MMKEKISAYIDGEGNKEELEKLLKEDPELKEYFEQLSFMKSALSEMNVQSPDVLGRFLKSE
ncbi:RseA family anti-sigma factor [Caldisericum sp.]|uniref:RseA family anti-sigma factor n=1 Tax=Caldisericum sp. TaxID=2499687 RepID=UPI003D0C49AC